MDKALTLRFFFRLEIGYQLCPSKELGPFAEGTDNVIQRKKNYPVDECYQNLLRYSLWIETNPVDIVLFKLRTTDAW